MSRSAAEDRLRVRRGRSPLRRLALLATAAIAGSLVLMQPVGAANEVHLVAAGDFGARTATNSVLTALGQTSLEIYFASYIIEAIIVNQLFVHFNTKARRQLNSVSIILFASFLIFICTKIVNLMLI